MANKPEQMPKTAIAAGVDQFFRDQERCEAEHRGDDIGMARDPFLAPIGMDDWSRQYHDREEFERQEGARMGHSTYERGTVFAAGHGNKKSELGQE